MNEFTLPQRTALLYLADGKLRRTSVFSVGSTTANSTAKFLVSNGLATKHFVRRSDGAEVTEHERRSMKPMEWAEALRITDLGRAALR
ncbi:MAG TPA: hypothetical protein VFI56_23210 [Vicinamibacterales bacterium]|nr:hypothetical protein [Vicinamibacterales bacterium]